METRRLNRSQISEIAAIIREGGLVAIPTDTVYGLAGLSRDASVYEHMKEVKSRPDSKPFPLMVSSYEQLSELVEMNDGVEHLVKTFMPGAVTFIFQKKEGVFPFLGEQNTLGIRMADDVFVKAVIEALGASVWLPSANLSGFPTGTSSKMVLEQLDSLIEGVVEGDITGGVSSSVFDLTNLPEIKEMRKGPISLENIEKSYKQYLEFKYKSDTITSKKGA